MDNELLNEYYIVIKNKISQSNYSSALGSIEKLLQNFPENSIGYYYEGVCNFALKKYDDAINSYTKAINADITNAKSYFNIGIVYYTKSDYDNALINIAKAMILFSKEKSLDAKQRCIDAINLIEAERKSMNS